MNIREFIQAHNLAHYNEYIGQRVTEVLLKSAYKEEKWQDVLTEAGFVNRRLTHANRYYVDDAYRWCKSVLGDEHFALIGFADFWFENEKDANWFSLRW